MADRPILSLRPGEPEVPIEKDALRFIERNSRYILQQVRLERSSTASVTLVWRDIPLVRVP